MTLWYLVLGLPLLGLGLFALVRTSLMAKALTAFPRNRLAGQLLCAVAWFGTAYECDNFGIDIFDKFLKVFPGEVWILAIVLTVLTCMWMENLLPIRALCGIFMLFPAELLPVTRNCVSYWYLAPVVFAYICAIIGMFGMFYPWRFRQVLTWVSQQPPRVRVAGGAFLAVGLLFTVLGALTASGTIR